MTHRAVVAATAHAARDPLERLATWNIPEAEQTPSLRDCMLYALSVGLGSKPTDPGHLRYASETQTVIVPSMVLTLAAPGFWFQAPELELDWVKLLNVEQSVRVGRLPAPGTRVRSRSEVTDIIDKGFGKGVLVGWRRQLTAETGELAASIASTVLLRSQGRSARVVKAGALAHVTSLVPQRSADAVVDVQTTPNSGLLYRLNGTLNPLHADPIVAARAGFSRPIMPGTASLGYACAVLLEHCCAFRAERLAAFGARLSAPVFPGDVLRHELWREDNVVSFRVGVPERGTIVLDRGRAELRRDAL